VPTRDAFPENASFQQLKPANSGHASANPISEGGNASAGPCAVTRVYRVEISGWDASQSFFAEKAELAWNEGGEKLVALPREVRDGAILFVRLLQPVSPDRSHPVPYVVEHIRQM
jgi:hypothetical protein